MQIILKQYISHQNALLKFIGVQINILGKSSIYLKLSRAKDFSSTHWQIKLSSWCLKLPRICKLCISTKDIL